MKDIKYTENAKNALTLARRAATKLMRSDAGTEHLLLGLLMEGQGTAATVLENNNVTAQSVRKLIKELIEPEADVAVLDQKGYTPRLMDVIELAADLAEQLESKEVGTEHLLFAILRQGDSVAIRILNTLDCSIQKIYVELMQSMGIDEKRYKEEFSKGQGKKNPKILAQYSRDLTKLAAEGKLDPVIGRETEIARVIQILSRRTKNNPCLIGEPGVGKSAVVEGLAERIVAGDVPKTVQNKRIITLDLASMVAGSKYRGEFEERIKKVVREVVEDGNIVLFLDELHTIIGAGGAEGALDASNILKPSLARGELQLIGATTIEEYRKYIEKDAALERRFQPVDVIEPTREQALDILKGIAHKYEEHHGVTITDEALVAAVDLSSRYINDRNLPDKAIDLMDEASAALKLNTVEIPKNIKELKEEIEKLDVQIERSLRFEAYTQAAEQRTRQKELKLKLEKVIKRFEKKQESLEYIVNEEDIARVVSQWTKIPLNKLEEKESDRLLKLEAVLHKRVIGQTEAVNAISAAIRRGRVGLSDPNRPIGSFLFLGPTGVGKTELSKALAEAVFGSENALIRVDMSEYMEGHSVSKMIGSPPGYVGFEEGGQLSEKVRRNPYSVVLFDEIEKAHPDVFNVLLQVLDDGHITDSKGRKVSFKNTILIMTSNAGASRIVEPKKLGFSTDSSKKKDYEDMKSAVMEEVKRLFKPEFINRIDDIIVFHPLEKKEMKEIVTLLSKDLAKRCENNMGIHLTLTNSMKEYLVDNFADYKMGARPLKRAIQNTIEDALATKILGGEIKSGDYVSAGVKDKKVHFTKKEG